MIRRFPGRRTRVGNLRLDDAAFPISPLLVQCFTLSGT